MNSRYDLLSFYNEGALNTFLRGSSKVTGLLGTPRTFNEDTDEALVTARGRLQLVEKTKDTPAHYRSTGEEVTLNNVLVYGGPGAFVMNADKDGARMHGDGTVKVINSINVWHHEWSLNTKNGKEYALMSGDNSSSSDDKINELELSLDGVGSVVQFVAGFAINLKYGVLTKDEGREADKDESRYGISFGGSIALPISAPKEKDKGDANGGKPDDKKKDEKPEKGKLSAAVDSLLYGQRKDGKTGFVGLNTTVELKLPENIMGALIKNGPGVEAALTINTIKHIYSLEFAVDMAIMECEGTIAFKQVPIRGVDTVLPDTLIFKLSGDVVSVPIVPPFVSVTGVGGGVSELADSFSDENIGELPPMTIHLMADLCMLETMIGEFEMALSLRGVSIEGNFHLRMDDEGALFKLKAGMTAQWVTPFFISAFGDISVYNGIIKGSFNAKISDDYFYGYIFAGIFIPKIIPLIGGMEIASAEAAVSSDFVGVNVRIIGIQFGVIYYWDGELKFGSALDLSSRGAAVSYDPQSYYNKQGELVESTMVYGTNLRRLTSSLVPGSRAGDGTITKIFDPSQQDALLLELPFTGPAPTPGEVTLKTPAGKVIEMVADDGNGGGNFLVQTRGEGGQYLYITITDPALLEAGEWTVDVATVGFAVDNFEVNGVDNLPALTEVDFTRNPDNNNELTVAWKTDCVGKTPGTLDVYLTKDKNVFEKLDADGADASSLMTPLARLELADASVRSTTVQIPDTFGEGEYYVVAMLSQYEGGISKVISTQSFPFANEKLPAAPEAVAVSYGGNGTLSIQMTDPAQPTYDTYLVTLLDEAGTPVPGGYGEYPQGALVNFNVSEKGTNTPLLKAGKVYSVEVATRRTELGKTADDFSYYYSTGSIKSETYKMPAINAPKLLSVESSIDPEIPYTQQTHLTATYRFDQPVYFYPTLDSTPLLLPTEAKTEWLIDTDLEDGAHAVLFTAKNAAGDTAQAYEFERLESEDPNIVIEHPNAVKGAVLAFETDSRDPVLTMAQSESKSILSTKSADVITGTSGQTVFVDEQGKITLTGLCEEGASLTLDGSDAGVTLGGDGIFTIVREVDTTKASAEFILKAVDKAGNSTSLIISVVNRDLAAFDSLLLIGSIKPEENAKYVELSLGQSLALTPTMKSGVKGLTVSPADVKWEVLYEQNIISLSNGLVTALAPGETAIKATYQTASYTDYGSKDVDGGLSDVILVKVKDADYRYKLIQTGAYTYFSVTAPESRGTGTVSLNNQTTMLLYDKANGCYVGVFAGTCSSDTLITNMTFVLDGKAPPALHLGDTDGDGIVTKKDIDAAIAVYLKKMDVLDGDLNALARSDMNGDRKVNIIDAQLVLQALYRAQGGKY